MTDFWLKFLRPSLCLASASVALMACVEYDAAPFSGHELPRVSGYKSGVTNDWIYFNLRSGRVYNASAPNKDIREGRQKVDSVALDWDLAFCGYQLRTNSGTSGIGIGGAADLGYGGYDHWTSASQVEELDFAADDSSSVSIVYSSSDWVSHLTQLAKDGKISYDDFDKYPWFDPNSGPRTLIASANPVLSQAMSFSGPPPVYTPSGHTYCIRTADGEAYFKFMLVSWYDADADIGDEGGRLSYYIDPLP